MLSLDTKFYELSIKGWIIIMFLVVFFFIFNFNTNEAFSNSEKKKSNLVKVYNFNTSWCGYSIRFQPEWDKFQKEVNSRNDLSNVLAFDIKCDNTDNKQMCNEYDISGYPSIIIELNDKKTLYRGTRTSDALIENIKNL